MAQPLSKQTFRLLQQEPHFSLGLGRQPDSSWRSLASLPLLILVGLTGAGKTSTLAHLAKPANRLVLPDRRVLTDQVILPSVCGTAEPQSLTREERFAATARFRQAHPGGMGDLLAALSLKFPGESLPPLVIFDGLRGQEEVTAAARELPQARFLLLQADDALRVQRLTGRGDAFDGLTTAQTADNGEAARVKAQNIVTRESQNYSLDETILVLQREARDRHLTQNSGQKSALNIARATEEFLTLKPKEKTD